jgi:transglutaminase superfamily protein
MIRRIALFFPLPPAAKAVVLRSLILLPIVALGLRIGGLARTRAWLNALVQPLPREAAIEPREIARLVHGTAAALRVSCLPRALLLLRILGGYGERVSMRIGVQTTIDAGFAAHAWVEFDGAALGEHPGVLESHAAFPALPG